MKRFALPACLAAVLAAGAAVPAHSAEHGWYIGAGLGYSKGDISDEAVGKTVGRLVPGSSVTSLQKNDDSAMWKLFLGYNFTSFIALEANAFRLGEFGFAADLFPPTVLFTNLDLWGGSLDVLGIIPLGDAWRVYARGGAVVAKSTANHTGAVALPDEEDTKWGWKAGAGIAYEFESGVAFRGEYEYYRVGTVLGEKLKTHVFSGSFLYRFK